MYSIPQVAKILNQSRTNVWYLVNSGKLKAEVIPGGRRREFRISQQAVDEYLNPKTDSELEETQESEPPEQEAVQEAGQAPEETTAQ